MISSTASWSISSDKILSQVEINTILATLTKKCAHSKQAVANRVIFRLAAFAGLRVSELIQIQLDDVVLNVERPYIRVRAEITKGYKARAVPIWSSSSVAEFVNGSKCENNGEPKAMIHSFARYTLIHWATQSTGPMHVVDGRPHAEHLVLSEHLIRRSIMVAIPGVLKVFTRASLLALFVMRPVMPASIRRTCIATYSKRPERHTQ